ncbi:hypothetical protein Trydic_g7121 [Trypoxylus dichotomus]
MSDSHYRHRVVIQFLVKKSSGTMRKQSQQWVEKDGERPTKAKISKSRLKAMLIIFFDIRGIIHREYVPTGQTVTGQLVLRWHPGTTPGTNFPCAPRTRRERLDLAP